MTSVQVPEGCFDAPGTVCLRKSSSGKAILVDIPEVGEVWVPLSLVHDDSEVYDEGHEGTLIVQEWFAEQEGWM